MDITNTQMLVAPCASDGNPKLNKCTRICAQISAIILVLVYGVLFVMSILFGPALLGLIILPDNGSSTTSGENKHFAHLMMTRIQLGLAFAISILLLYGVQKKKPRIILVWIVYYLISCGFIFLNIIFFGETYTHFEKVFTVKLIVLGFFIFFGILSYYKQLLYMDGKTQSNSREILVTIADPVQPNLYQQNFPPYSQQPHWQQAHFQPYLQPNPQLHLQNQWFQPPSYSPKDTNSAR